MKVSGILICILFSYGFSYAQVDLGAITSLMDQPRKKIENYLGKKGFTRENFLSQQELVFTSQQLEDSITVNRSCQFIFNQEKYEFVYRTSSAKEHSLWKKELLSTSLPFSSNGSSGLYYNSKQNLKLKYVEERIDTTVSYTLLATRKTLPRIRDLVYAEDLLEIDAHVYLETVFGKQNVKEDLFFFSETLKNKCSIIYPNSNRQAIFIWKDEINMTDLSFIIIGEYENKSVTNLHAPLTLAQWKSRQGISCGMNLKELEMINQKAISFYRWRSPMSGTMHKNDGAIDFKRIEIVLDCMNCSFVTANGDEMVINSTEANLQKQKWYVRSFAVLPEKLPGE